MAAAMPKNGREAGKVCQGHQSKGFRFVLVTCGVKFPGSNEPTVVCCQQQGHVIVGERNACNKYEPPIATHNYSCALYTIVYVHDMFGCLVATKHCNGSKAKTCLDVHKLLPSTPRDSLCRQ